MTTLSLSFRTAFNAEDTEEFPVILIEITPDGSADTYYLSSEPAALIFPDPDTGHDRYGIVHQGVEYPWLQIAASWPDDQEGKPPSTTLTFANVVEDMSAQIRAVTPGTRATVIMKMVLSSAPDEIEDQKEMIATGGGFNAQQVTLNVSREPIEMEPWPAQCMSKDEAPGLFR